MYTDSWLENAANGLMGRQVKHFYYNVLSNVLLFQLVSFSEIEDLIQIIDKDGRIKFEVNIIPAFSFSMKGKFL